MLAFALGVLTGVYFTVAAFRYNREIEKIEDELRRQSHAGWPFPATWRHQLTATWEALKWPWHAVQAARDIWREDP